MTRELNPDDWQRLDALFHDALEHPPEAWDALLAQACPDTALRAEVAAMLAADLAERSRSTTEPQKSSGDQAATDDALGAIVRDGAAALTELRFEGLDAHDGTPDTDSGATSGDPPFDALGPYRLIEELGRGGLATVYLAERDDAQFTMRVAVKLIRRGLDSPDLLDRLRLERQILARLEHPNIARLIDGGTAPDGRPYFVMELVEGDRIDHWCERQELDLRQRLVLFRQLCEAVHSAHRRLVLHRDIKPSNVLVNRAGVPKLLDFGIAKLLADEDELTLGFSTLTEPGMRLLTPEFASPEQVRGETLTTASDVYSLGVLLYLLVTGKPPYALDRRRPAEVERVVCTVNPRRPSAVVGTTLRRQRLGWPRRASGDDLDTIVLEALRKEPERRYGSAARLAEDLRCYLEDLPVSARRDSLRYRTGKFVRRHRVPVAAVVALFIVLVAAVLTTSWQARVARQAQRVAEEEQHRAEVARQTAELQRRRAEEATTFLVDLFEISDPYRTLGERVTARELLDRGARSVRQRLGDDPRLRATLLSTIARVYRNLSLFDEAESLFLEALEVRSEELGEQAPEVVDSQLEVALLRLDQERFDEAKRQLEGILRHHRQGDDRQGGDRQSDDPEALALALHYLALTHVGLGNLETAETHLQEALALRQQLDDPLAVATTRDALGELARRRNDYPQAREILGEVLALRRERLGDRHPLVAHTLNDLAITAQQAGQLATAEALYLEVLATQESVFGERHSHLVTTLHNLASVRVDQAKLADAWPLYERAEALVLDLFGAEHPALARVLWGRARAHLVEGAFATAADLARRAWEIDAAFLGEDHPSTLRDLNLLARCQVALGAPEAQATLTTLVTVLRRTLPDGDARLAHPLLQLAGLLLSRDDAASAEPLFREALELRRRAQPVGHWEIAQAEGQLGRCWLRLGRPEDAEPLLRSSLATLTERFGADHVQTRAVAGYLETLTATRTRGR